MLEKNNGIGNQVSTSIKKGFNSEPLYNKKNLKTKIKSHEGKINTNFHGDNIPKEGSECIYLSVVLIDSAFRVGKDYYPQVFLEVCKCLVKQKRIPK